MAERRRLDKTAWLTTIPLVALVVAEFVTWLDRRPGGTVSETNPTPRAPVQSWAGRSHAPEEAP